MSTTGTVLYLRGAGAEAGGSAALEPEFEVRVAEDAVDAIKQLSATSPAPDCLVAPTAPGDLRLDALIDRVGRIAPETAVLVVGELPVDAAAAAALVEADAYLPASREPLLAERVHRLLERRRVDRAIAQHDRLGRAVGTIAITLASAPDRPTIESAVHDGLVETGCYRHVWIASVDGDEPSITRPISGHLGEEQLRELAGGDPGVLARAVETGRVTATEAVVRTRTTAAGASGTAVGNGNGARSLATAAVPFVHGGQVYGVGLVSTDRDRALDGAEREHLADLGAVVGHALRAVDTGTAVGSAHGRSMENLVHDLRNPLGIARSHLEISLEDDEDEALERVRAALDRMVETVDRVAAGVGGRRDVEAGPVPLADAAETAWTSVDAPEASLEVTDSTTVVADRELLVRLLANLLQNAVDHGGASVSIRVGPVPGGFFVADDGPGIPSADRRAVFERGFSTDANGLGVGLSIVEDAASAHGWSLSVTESRDGGARFELSGIECVEDDTHV